jgi:hypothetical protein
VILFSREAINAVRQVLLLCIFSGLMIPTMTWADDQPQHQSLLFSTRWSAEAYSEKAAGTVCWIDGSDGSQRIEVLRSERAWSETSRDLSPLMDRTGNGWTLVMGPDLNGTINAWDNQWRTLPAGLAQLVRLVTASLHSYPESPGRYPFARRVAEPRREAGIPRPQILAAFLPDPAKADTWRFQLAPLSLGNDQPTEEADFRRRMTVRGRGTGGVGEVLVLRWMPRTGPENGPDRYQLSLSSSRRPGTLHLDAAGSVAVATPEPEVFLPLWPMSQFFQVR